METLVPYKPTASHPEHDPKWLFPSSDLNHGPLSQKTDAQHSCLACIVELLEDSNMLVVKKKLVLAEMLRLLSFHSNQMLALLSGDLRVTAHVALIITGMYPLPVALCKNDLFHEIITTFL